MTIRLKSIVCLLFLAAPIASAFQPSQYVKNDAALEMVATLDLSTDIATSNDIDISTVLAEVESALRATEDSLASVNKLKPAQIQKFEIDVSTRDDIDISDVLAEAEEALKVAETSAPSRNIAKESPYNLLKQAPAFAANAVTMFLRSEEVQAASASALQSISEGSRIMWEQIRLTKAPTKNAMVSRPRLSSRKLDIGTILMEAEAAFKATQRQVFKAPSFDEVYKLVEVRSLADVLAESAMRAIDATKVALESEAVKQAPTRALEAIKSFVDTKKRDAEKKVQPPPIDSFFQWSGKPYLATRYERKPVQRKSAIDGVLSFLEANKNIMLGKKEQEQKKTSATGLAFLFAVPSMAVDAIKALFYAPPKAKKAASGSKQAVQNFPYFLKPKSSMGSKSPKAPVRTSKTKIPFFCVEKKQ